MKPKIGLDYVAKDKEWRIILLNVKQNYARKFDVYYELCCKVLFVWKRLKHKFFRKTMIPKHLEN